MCERCIAAKAMTMILEFFPISWHLEPGDCLAMEIGPPIVSRNQGRRPARCLVAFVSTPSASRTAP